MALTRAKLQFKTYFQDIRFWILLFFVLRLIGITQPPLEIAHNWRQSTVTMVARNFYETDANIFYPRIDIAGDKSGVTGMEFPIFNYLIYLASLLFGYDHWYGRLVNLIFSSWGVLAFYRLVHSLKNERWAFSSSLILLSSLWFIYSRKIMPDTFAMSLMMIGLYSAYRFLKDEKGFFRLMGYFIAVMVGVLAKLPVVLGFSLLPFLLLDTRFVLQKRISLGLTTLLAVVPALVWYFYWVQHLNQQEGFVHFFMGKDWKTGALELFENRSAAANMFYETAIKFVGFGLFIAGIVLTIVKKEKMLFAFWIVSSVLFVAFMFKAGDNFTRHSYYMIPYIPVMAFFAAYPLQAIKNKKIASLLLMAVVLEGIINQQHDFVISEKNKTLLQLESIVDEHFSDDVLLLVNSGEYPTPMYFAHRKGWVASNLQIADTAYVKSLKDKGLGSIVVLKQAFGSDLLLPYPQLYDDAHFRLYRP